MRWFGLNFFIALCYLTQCEMSYFSQTDTYRSGEGDKKPSASLLSGIVGYVHMRLFRMMTEAAPALSQCLNGNVKPTGCSAAILSMVAKGLIRAALNDSRLSGKITSHRGLSAPTISVYENQKASKHCEVQGVYTIPPGKGISSSIICPWLALLSKSQGIEGACYLLSLCVPLHWDPWEVSKKHCGRISVSVVAQLHSPSQTIVIWSAAFYSLQFAG